MSLNWADTGVALVASSAVQFLVVAPKFFVFVPGKKDQ
jgi:hypothetical protein